MVIREESRYNINRLLKLKGISRLEIKDSITEKLLNKDTYKEILGLSLRFIESRKKSSDSGHTWNEYLALFDMLKIEDNAEYLSYVMKSLTKLSELFLDFDIDFINLEDINCDEANHYYILIYMRKDDLNDDYAEDEITKMFKELEV